MTRDPWLTHRLSADHDPLALLEREWLLTNGTGAFAAGTAAGCPTRRYHALLIAATDPPVGRVATLNQVWEQLVLHRPGQSATQSLAFNTLMFRAPEGHRVFAPRGVELLRAFERGMSARWIYSWGDLEFERELFLHWKQQAITLRYRVRGLSAARSRATLRLNPMLTLRDFHGLRYAHDPVHHKADGHVLRAYHEDLALTMALRDAEDTTPARFEANPHWWYGIHYPIEAERGQGDAEDYFVPGALVMELPERDACELTLTAALGADVAEARESATAGATRAARLEPTVAALASPAQPASKQKSEASESKDDKLARVLALASDDFLVGRRIRGQALSTIIAGYPWFADWGRDTFIALPGLLLETQRHDEAKQVLRAFASNLHHGLVPNRFDDYHDEAAHYNTVDASLWFVHAALQYLHVTEDHAAWRDWLGPACARIVEAYRAGTDYDIHCDADGLVAAGSPHTQLTWMDAAVGDHVFTPRPGKAVEVNALWYHALRGLAETLERSPLKENADAPRDLAPAALHALADTVAQSFNDVFWDEDRGHLLDHVWTNPEGEAEPSGSCRPNQVFAVALAHSPLTTQRQQRVLEAVRDRLLTPVGLRTLSPDDPAYQGMYRGDQMQRDGAYHQGTVWPWLIGPYAEAVLRVGGFSDAAQREAEAAITPLLETLLDEGPDTTPRQSSRGCVGQLHEIYEAEPDEHGCHRPVGAFAQAWSVAEMLRVWRMARRADV